MKKVFAILLLVVHLFNLTGYPLFFQYFIGETDKRIVQELDKGNYNDADLVQIKVSVPLPYSVNWKEYERYDGSIEIKGVQYNYVKRRLYNDTLYLLCLPNDAKTELCKAQNEYAKNVSDIPFSSGKKGTESIVKKGGFGTEYGQQNTQYNFSPAYLYSNRENIFIIPELINCFIAPPAQPPEISS